MSEVIVNATGCILTRSHITGEVLCRWPGANCDCLVQRIDASYASYANHPAKEADGSTREHT